MQKPTYDIRPAVPSDAGGIIECMQSVMSERIYLISEIYLFTERGQKDMIKNPDDLTLICYSDHKIVGTLTVQRGIYRKNRHTANLGIAVKSGFRGIGIGTGMIRHAIKWSARQGIMKLNLDVFYSNIEAIKLYEKMGFITEGRRRKQFLVNDEYVDDVMMTVYPLEMNELE